MYRIETRFSKPYQIVSSTAASQTWKLGRPGKLNLTAESRPRGIYSDISRAYYAMFYAASALLASKNISRSKHSGVHSAFGQYFVKPGLIEPQYSRMLINAFNIRLDSDYEAKPSLSRALAEDILSDARQFVERITAYLHQEGYL